MQTILYLWVAALMTAVRIDHGEAPAPWAESYMDTAVAIADRCADNFVPGGKWKWCVAIAVEMSWQESRFNPQAEHDSGAGLGLFGTHASTLGRPVPKDQAGQVDAFLSLLETSFRICRKHPIEERLGWYAAGGEGCERRLELSRSRMHEASRLLREHPAPVLASPADTVTRNP